MGKLKDFELKVLSELMKNSRRSDRELAKLIGVSQPTVTRARDNLEKRGLIKEYTAIPDFSQLGYGLLAVTLAKAKLDSTPEQINKARETIMQFVNGNLGHIMMFERLPEARSVIILSYHRTYSDFENFMNPQNYNSIDVSLARNYLVDLEDNFRSQMRPLTLSTMADEILHRQEKAEQIGENEQPH
jgi:DNA-binding Lrp family transcriptional regulator